MFMAVYSLEEAPKEVQELVAAARNSNITPIDFCRELTRLGIQGPIKIWYVRDAFGLPLAQAKKLVIEFDYGSVEAWAEGIVPAIDELVIEADEDGSNPA